jgi:hypothetical protein
MGEVELTTTQVAARLEADARLIRLWCQQGRFKNARQVDTPRGAVWLIPESDLKGFKPPKMGRPPKAKVEMDSKADKKKGGKK